MSNILINTFADLQRVKASLILNDIDINAPHSPEEFEKFCSDANSMTSEAATSFVKAVTETPEDGDNE